jgi:hypothetical protein
MIARGCNRRELCRIEDFHCAPHGHTSVGVEAAASVAMCSSRGEDEAGLAPKETRNHDRGE